MKVSYREAARDDVIRQFRYYLVAQDLPRVAIRFREAVKATIHLLQVRPLIGARFQSDQLSLRELRSWPVAGFESIRIYYFVSVESIQVIRILHGKRDVIGILAAGADS